MNNDFKDIMQNRKSIRHYDSSVKISRDELLEIINESGRLTLADGDD